MKNIIIVLLFLIIQDTLINLDTLQIPDSTDVPLTKPVDRGYWSWQ